MRIISPICILVGHDWRYDSQLFTSTHGKKAHICRRCDKVEGLRKF